MRVSDATLNTYISAGQQCDDPECGCLDPSGGYQWRLMLDLRDAREELAELRGNENADEAWTPPTDETCKRHPRHNFECRECLRHHAAVMLREQEALRRLFAADTERYREAFELARDMAEYGRSESGRMLGEGYPLLALHESRKRLHGIKMIALEALGSDNELFNTETVKEDQ